MLSLITLAAAFLKLPEALGAVTLGAAASVTLLGLALLVARKSHRAASQSSRSPRQIERRPTGTLLLEPESDEAPTCAKSEVESK